MGDGGNGVRLTLDDLWDVARDLIFAPRNWMGWSGRYVDCTETSKTCYVVFTALLLVAGLAKAEAETE